MLKFTKLCSGYKATLSNGNQIKIEKHCEENYWIGFVLTSDYEEVANTYCTANTKKELVKAFNNEYA